MIFVVSATATGVAGLGERGGADGPGCCSSLSLSSSLSFSSSLSSLGRLNTSSFPFTNRLFFIGASGLLSSPSLVLPSPLVFDLSFFFCLFARFLAVFAFEISSASRFFLSNSASTVSYLPISLNARNLTTEHTFKDSSSNIFNLSYSLRLLALYTWNSPLPAPALDPWTFFIISRAGLSVFSFGGGGT